MVVVFCSPGRMEVQIEIGLPDEKGRWQILNIHSNRMKENSFLGGDVDVEELGTILSLRKFCIDVVGHHGQLMFALS